jgi:alkaline phosphatase D
MRYGIAYFIGMILCSYGSGQTEEPEVLPASAIVDLPKRIAFGSCANENKPQPVLNRVVEQSPDVFVYLGDNIYGDSRNMKVLRAKYAKLAAKPEFQTLRKKVPVLSIWDDHDYGENDAGKNYPFASESREIFLDFWKVPADSPRRTHEGIYGSHVFSSKGHTLQIVLLDTRSFRSPLKRNPLFKAKGTSFKNDYQPDSDPSKTLLGETQWLWLEEQLKAPADIRIIASSIQFGHEYNGYESWTNLPVEQQKLIDTILYPIYDITASGITETWPKIEPNQFRIANAVPENHFGMIDIDWEAKSPTISFKIINLKGETRLNEDVNLASLQFPQ